MKVALVWNAPYRLVEITTRFEPYVEGFVSIGVETITVCPVGTELGYPYPVSTFQDEDRVNGEEYWRELNCDAVIIFTWHRMTPILAAAKAAGLKVINLGESDGLVSIHRHPWSTFRYMTFMQSSLRGMLGAAKQWIERFFLRRKRELSDLIENVSISDAFCLAGEGAVEVFRSFLRSCGYRSLCQKVQWVPYPILESFCSNPVIEKRLDRVLAIGRWDSPQKNTPLLIDTIVRLFSHRAGTEVLIAGTPIPELIELASISNRVRILGKVTRDELRILMGESRTLLITSRWESGPIVASEMLAQGGTIVGTPLPNLCSMTRNPLFGQVSKSSNCKSLAFALESELDLWDAGMKSPNSIADFWRVKVNPSAVALRLRHLIEHSSK